MPEEHAGVTEEQAPAATPADELAKDVVGAPIRCWRCVVDDDGLHARRGLLHGSIDIPWRDVTAVYAKGIAVVVEGKRGIGGPGPLFAIHGSSGARAAVLAAWVEYSDRRLERDGRLDGAWSRPLRMKAISVAMLGVLLFFIAGFLAFRAASVQPWPGFEHRGHGNYCHYKGRRPPPATQIAMSWLAAMTLGVGGIALVAFGALRHRLVWLRGEDWSRWEVTRDGIAWWYRGKRMVLEPGPGDRIGPEEAVIGGERVPLRQMAWPLASRLVMAMGERAGTKLRRPRSAWLVPALLFGAAIGLAGFLAEGGSYADEFIALGALPLVAPVVEMILAAKRRKKGLFHGRAMLERLGW
jgi:hypothetical protein